MSIAEELEEAWASRVRGNREQVARLGEVGDGPDFYAPSVARFVEDPRRADDPVLDALLELARPDDAWLDIGAGAGRFALPLGLAVREVIAVEPSPAMREALVEGAERHRIANLRIVDARWPMDDPPRADVALIAHVGYDIEAIGPFLDAMEQGARRLCVAVLMDRSPASVAEPFWPVVHGEERVPLPALGELVALLRARGRIPEERRIAWAGRTWPDDDAALDWLRSQLWIRPDSALDDRLRDAFERLAIRDDDGVRLPHGPRAVALVTWELNGNGGQPRAA